MKVASIILAGLFMASAYGQVWELDKRLTYESHNSRDPSVAVSGENIHVVWEDDREGNYEIYYKRSTDNGQTWGIDERLTNAFVFSFSPSVAVSGDTIHVVWRDDRNEMIPEIYYKRSFDNGQTWGTDKRLTNETHETRTPSVAVSGENIHVVWSDNRDENYEIYYKRSTDNGQAWGTDKRLTNALEVSGLPSVAVSGENIHVVWQDNRKGNWEIHYKRSTDNGQSWGTHRRFKNETHNSWDPSVAVSGDNIHVVWQDTRDGNYEIYYKRSTDNGQTWGQDTRLTNETHKSYPPSIAVSGENIHVVWFDHRHLNDEIYYKRSHNNGQTWGPDKRLTNETHDSQFPSVTASGENIHVVWQDERDGNDEIYYKHGGEAFRPDNQIKNGDEATYIGDNIYNSAGNDQTKEQEVNPETPAVYHIKIENDGLTPDNIRVTGNGSWGGWTVRYYDALSGGTDITPDVTGEGWFTGELSPNDSKEIRVEMTPGSSTSTPGYFVLVTSTSLNAEPKKKDAVMATIRVRDEYQPDNQIKNSDEAAYIGDNIYNSAGNDQTKEQEVNQGATAVYHIKIENDGSAADNIKATGTGDAPDWIVRYYDALSGGTDITPDVTGAGWSTGDLSSGGSKEIRVEVTPAPSAQQGSSYDVQVTSTSDNDDSKKDVVKAITRVAVVGVKEDISQIPRDYFLCALPNPSGNMAVLKYGLPKESRTSLLVYDIKGSIVRTLTRAQNQEPGTYTVVWDGCDKKGMRLPSGVYFYQLKTRDSSITKKMTLMR